MTNLKPRSFTLKGIHFAFGEMGIIADREQRQEKRLEAIQDVRAGRKTHLVKCHESPLHEGGQGCIMHPTANDRFVHAAQLREPVRSGICQNKPPSNGIICPFPLIDCFFDLVFRHILSLIVDAETHKALNSHV